MIKINFIIIFFFSIYSYSQPYSINFNVYLELSKTIIDPIIFKTEGFKNWYLSPDGEINRAELTKMVVAAIIQPDEKTFNNCFSDVEDQWFAPYICYAKDKGWVAGYDDGNFKPESQITRVEAMKIILEANISCKRLIIPS